MPRILLLDNDFILKISALDLVEEFTSLPFIQESELRHLQALRYMIASGKLKNYSLEGLQRAQGWIATFPEVEAVDPRFHDLIPPTPGIDVGEKLLLATVLQRKETSIFTGDKRCIIAVGGLPATFQTTLNGRILCLEAALRAIMAREDFNHMLDKVRPGLSCDRTMLSIFGSHGTNNEASVHDGFTSYLSDISTKPGGSLLIAWETLL